MGPSQVTEKMEFYTNKNLPGPFYIGPVQTSELCLCGPWILKLSEAPISVYYTV